MRRGQSASSAFSYHLSLITHRLTNASQLLPPPARFGRPAGADGARLLGRRLYSLLAAARPAHDSRHAPSLRLPLQQGRDIRGDVRQQPDTYARADNLSLLRGRRGAHGSAPRAARRGRRAAAPPAHTHGPLLARALGALPGLTAAVRARRHGAFRRWFAGLVPCYPETSACQPTQEKQTLKRVWSAESGV